MLSFCNISQLTILLNPTESISLRRQSVGYSKRLSDAFGLFQEDKGGILGIF